MSKWRDYSAAINAMNASRRPAPPPAAIAKPEPVPLDPREDKLLPCFRCGRKATLHFHPGDYGYTPPTVRAGCQPCGLWSPPRQTEEYNLTVGHFDNERVAVAACSAWWNKREGST